MVYPGGKLSNLTAGADFRQRRGKHFGGERVRLDGAVLQCRFLDRLDALDLYGARMD
jgi:hypothetical protein